MGREGPAEGQERKQSTLCDVSSNIRVQTSQLLTLAAAGEGPVVVSFLTRLGLETGENLAMQQEVL
jgi:Sec-independent protein secretion pathway component TatC